MEWNYINNSDDVEYIQKLYGNFEDVELVSFSFESGNYIDDDLVGYETNSNNLHVIFQRMDINPFSIEVIFENMGQILYLTPMNKEYTSDILFAKFVKTEDCIYWTTWDEFDPYNKEHLSYGDFDLIKARRAKWRIIS